jgi:hypothetical protein
LGGSLLFLFLARALALPRVLRTIFSAEGASARVEGGDGGGFCLFLCQSNDVERFSFSSRAFLMYFSERTKP